MKDDEKQSFLENNSNERTKERLIVKEDQVFVTNMDIDVDVEDQLEKKKKDDDILSFLKISSIEEQFIVKDNEEVYETTMDVDVDENQQKFISNIIIPNSSVKKIIINLANGKNEMQTSNTILGKRKYVQDTNRRSVALDYIKEAEEEEELTSLKLIIEDKLKGLMKNKAKD